MIVLRPVLIGLLSLLVLPFLANAQSDLVAGDPFISAEAAHELVGKRGVVFLHVGQSEDAFAEGHIPGARFLPLSALTEDRDGVPRELPPAEELTALLEGFGITDNGRVIIYSDPSLGDIETLAAARAYFTLDVLGHPYVAVMDGGLDAWRRADFELTAGPTANNVTSLELQGRSSDVIVDAADIAVRLDDKTLFLADARPPAQYSGEEPGADVERPGHIPGATNLFWKDFLDDDGTLKPTEQIAEMWHDSGLTRDHDVIVYCRTGMQASFAYLVARHLGVNPKMYDASYIDWSNNTRHPVER